MGPISRSRRLEHVPGSTDRLAQTGQNGFELCREWSLGADDLVCRRRRELDPPRMEEQPRQAVRPTPGSAGRVDGVTRDGVTDGGKVHAYLVRPASVQVNLEQRPAGETLLHAVAGHR